MLICLSHGSQTLRYCKLCCAFLFLQKCFFPLKLPQSFSFLSEIYLKCCEPHVRLLWTVNTIRQYAPEVSRPRAAETSPGCVLFCCLIWSDSGGGDFLSMSGTCLGGFSQLSILTCVSTKDRHWSALTSWQHKTRVYAANLTLNKNFFLGNAFLKLFFDNSSKDIS